MDPKSMDPIEENEKIVLCETATSDESTSLPMKVECSQENILQVECSKAIISEKADKENNQSQVEHKTEDRLMEEDNEDFVVDTKQRCYDCDISHCVMWRKLSGTQLLCNICHLKRIKNNVNQNGGNFKNNNNGYNITSQSSRTKDTPAVRISKRKSKSNKKFANGAFTDRVIKNGHSKNRRNLFKKKPLKSKKGVASIVASNCIYHDGLLYEVGDVVCTSDIHGGTYFAQLRGFLQDDYCEKSAVVTWLIPTVPNLQHFDPMLFVPGLDEENARAMECFSFVCHAPTDLFKSRRMHPQYLRTQSNLDSLIYAAKSLESEKETEADETGDNSDVIENVVVIDKEAT